ncbi:MAG: AAA family ATPase, partial [Verrucomicrobiota bacterium]
MNINLSTLRKTAVRKPVRALVYGVHGVGKTTFATKAPKSVALCVEDGLGSINVPSWDLTKASFQDVMDAIATL